jgi:hypothetical protein
MPAYRSPLAAAVIASVDIVEAIITLRFGRAVRTVFDLSDELARHRLSGAGLEEDPTDKLNAASKHLRDALGAIEQMRVVYDREEERLTNLIADLNEKREQLGKLAKDHEVAAKLRNQDVEAVRSVLGIGEIERAIRGGKIAGFVTGVLASILASIIFLGAQRFYDRYQRDRFNVVVAPATRTVK